MSNRDSAVLADPPRDIAFGNDDFERIRRLIRERAGISLNDSKRQMAYSRLSRRVRATGTGSFAAYLDRLERDGGDEWQEFINALTTNLTSFFREQHHFPVLLEFARNHLKTTGKPPRLWCSAASTGEEPYSIAMTLDEAGCGNARMVASDIDTNVLAQAARGVYKAESAQSLDPARLKRYFMRGTSTNSGLVRVRPEMRRMIEFRQVNLLDATWNLGDAFDVIFCRNVMIYFDKPTQHSILEKFARVLRPGGLLFAGHSENFSDFHGPFVLRGKTVYERR
ncbi:CheR family methyltransferase [Derxia lacustris]|uniref:CheR family methyltransferase n=1 Tax=Derxia lacustris TaxID=764842 RepID=UPI000A16EAA0|nr:CheR family methyltransferase [Derxia lacustris]